MSLSLSNAVWRHSPARGTPLLVLLCIADCTTEKSDGWIWLSMNALAERCRLSVRSVQLATSQLERAGALQIDMMRGRHGTNCFRVIEPVVGGRPKGPRELSGAQRRARASRKLVQPVSPGVQPVSPGEDATGFTGVKGASPGGRSGFHRSPETNFTPGVKPVARRGEKGFTQDELSTSSVDERIDETRDPPPPLGPPSGGKVIPPVPPVGGVLRQQPADGSDSRDAALKDAQASSKATASRLTSTSRYHPGD